MNLLYPTTVTAENIETVRELLPCDHAAEIEVGCETWGITYGGGQRGQITVWPEQKRAAGCYRGDSDWGDWSEESRTITLEDGRVIDADGEEVTEGEE
ncbi:hypothetical protein GAY30_12705 [Azospirillum brasilense]|uniref:hypothetical protein n=1 Tax=Azospirillum brasilense TaxID=192 RepID=UPI00157B6710|nr:hypothetical protein [Azospirillum brasilense]NUB25745.1 hypothetical protein [Azospirillum brasilense]